MVILGDIPDESTEISGGLTNGQLLSRLREVTNDPADFETFAEEGDETAESEDD
ncbi:MAG: hypothetical protein KAI64_00930 [Thermoplasmata archaeon]|nr:hypothetical protein [Thermoplasmata archaeon]